MRLIELGKSRKINISFKEIEELMLSENNYKTKIYNINANIDSLANKRRFLCELKLPLHNSSYGLLGAYYVPDNSSNFLNIEVNYIDEKFKHYVNTIAYSKDNVFIGIFEDYADMILNTAFEKIQKHTNIPKGRIVFDACAYCIVGSSNKIFSILTKIILDVLLNEKYPLNDDTLKIIFEKYLLERYI